METDHCGVLIPTLHSAFDSFGDCVVVDDDVFVAFVVVVVGVGVVVIMFLAHSRSRSLLAIRYTHVGSCANGVEWRSIGVRARVCELSWLLSQKVI